MNKKIFSVLLLIAFYNQFSCAMQLIEPWIALKSWEDVKPFVGHFVVYKTTNDYFKGRDNKGNPINSDESLNYGFIDTKPKTFTTFGKTKTAYQMFRIVKPNDTPMFSFCMLTNRMLKQKMNSDLLLRFATPEEIKQISEAINLDKAQVDGYSPSSKYLVFACTEYQSIIPPTGYYNCNW